MELKFIIEDRSRVPECPPNCTLVELKFSQEVGNCFTCHSKLYLSGIEMYNKLLKQLDALISKLYLSGIEIQDALVAGVVGAASKLYLSGIEISQHKGVASTTLSPNCTLVELK